MKKKSLFLAVLVMSASALVAQPQLEKGNVLAAVASTVAVHGSFTSEFMSFGITTIKNKTGSDPSEAVYRITSFNILPKAGYFVMDNLAAGLQVIASGYKEKSLWDEESHTEHAIGIGPFVRFYYPLDKIYPFIEAESLFGTRKEAWYSNEEKSPFVMLGILLGASLPLGDKVTFDGSAGYVRSSFKNTNVETEETYHDVTGGLGLRLGFTIYL